MKNIKKNFRKNKKIIEDNQTKIKYDKKPIKKNENINGEGNIDFNGKNEYYFYKNITKNNNLEINKDNIEKKNE